MHLLITAGPTREPIDPVRYLTNRSSGKMGFALAAAAVRHGHRVTLIAGPTALDVPPHVDYLPVETAQQMYEATRDSIGRVQGAIFAAAVADYRPLACAPGKIKKRSETLTLELVRTPDILGAARREFGFMGILVGFAAETENIEANAREKLVRKHCDLVVANDVSRRGIGFDSDHNEILLVYPDRTEAPPQDSKDDLSHLIIQAVEELDAHRSDASE